MTDSHHDATPDAGPTTASESGSKLETETETGPEGETSIQRALRLKQAGIEARPKPPRGGRFQREQAARIATGSSKPWMKK